MQVNLYTLAGLLIEKKFMTQEDECMIKAPTESGVYLLQVVVNDVVFVEKIVVSY